MENFHYKRLPFVNVANVRDLGGYPLEEGHATRYGMFFRSGRLFNANKSEIDYLKKLGVKSIIDLRLANEFIEQPDSCWLDPHFTIHNISLFGEMAKSACGSTRRHGPARAGSSIYPDSRGMFNSSSQSDSNYC